MQSQGRNLTRHIAMLAMFSALSIICAYIENLIPFSFGIPGIKLGLSNLITLLILYIGRNDACSLEKQRLTDAGIVILIRITLISLLFSNLYSLIYSLSGGIFSLLCMWFFSGCDKISIVGCSITGGITHNLAQLIVAILIVEQLKVIYYAPILLLAGTLTGLLIGLLSKMIVSRGGIRKIYDRFFER